MTTRALIYAYCKWTPCAGQLGHKDMKYFENSSAKINLREAFDIETNERGCKGD